MRQLLRAVHVGTQLFSVALINMHHFRLFLGRVDVQEDSDTSRHPVRDGDFRGA